jgi:leucyl aminopeptidase
MLPEIEITKTLQSGLSAAVLFQKTEIRDLPLVSPSESDYLEGKLKEETEWVLSRQPLICFYHKSEEKHTSAEKAEAARKAGSLFYDALKKEKISTFQVVAPGIPELIIPFLEGLLLSAYSFSKYKKKRDDFMPRKIFLIHGEVTLREVEELRNLIQAVYRSRDLVNEPLSYLTASRFAEEIKEMAAKSGFSVEVFNKKKIEALRMGGLLAVNKGSLDPPTFSVLEWKPDNARNSQPVVLAGKGVVFDTGGLSLKPTKQSMDYMKCDMAGGAVVAATLSALAENNIPLHVIGLIPATDNRPDGNAYVPGDVVTMFDGTTVEIKNTDAEGRLLLADALSYAKKYNPLLVIDIATLTGSAEIITGSQALVAMGNSEEKMKQLKECGATVHERVVDVPLWEEFKKPLQSAIADLNNLGVREGQTSIAGKFLEHFTDYPWLHLDIAGVAFLQEKDFYRPAGATGFGTRLLYHFLKKFN